MIGMNADMTDSVEHIAEGIKRSKLDWRQGILREDSAVWKDYTVQVFPQKIVVDKKGVVRYLDNFITKEQLEKLIEQYR